MTEIKFLSQIARLPDLSTGVYRLQKPEITEESVRKLADRFGLVPNSHIGVVKNNLPTITYTEGFKSVALFKASGALRYRDYARWQIDDKISNFRLTDDEAIDISRHHIRRLELVTQDEYQLSKISRLHVGFVEKATGFSDERAIAAKIIYKRIIQGIPVEGSGGKLVLYIDHNGELTGVDRIWRELDGIHLLANQIQLHSPQIAEEDLRIQHRKYKGKIEVKEARLGYYELGWKEEQNYLQPAYVFSMEVMSPNARFKTFKTHIVPAIVNSLNYGRLICTPVSPIRHKPPRQPPAYQT